MSEPNDEKVILTKTQIKELVDETVHETLIKLGIESSDFREMQRDFIFMRQLRYTSEEVKGKALLILVGTIVTVTIGAIGIGIKSIIMSGGRTP